MPDCAFALVKTTVCVEEPIALLDKGTLCVELVTGTEIRRLVGWELALASAAPAAPDNDNENG